MMTNIYNNKFYKLAYEFIHQYRIDSAIVFFGGYIGILLLTAFMVSYTMFSFIVGTFTAYNNKSWVLAIAPIASVIFIVLHLGQGNPVSAFFSFIPGCIISWIWAFFVFLLFIFALFLPLIKLFRTHGIHVIAMLLLIIRNIFTFLFGWIIGYDTTSYEPTRYDKIINELEKYSKGIMICISFIVLMYAYQYLTKGIAIGMTICCFYLLYIHQHSKTN